MSAPAEGVRDRPRHCQARNISPNKVCNGAACDATPNPCGLRQALEQALAMAEGRRPQTDPGRVAPLGRPHALRRTPAHLQRDAERGSAERIGKPAEADPHQRVIGRVKLPGEITTVPGSPP